MQGTSKGDPSTQLWVGNIPPHIGENQVLEEMACYDFRPSKLVLRQRPSGVVRKHNNENEEVKASEN